MPRKVGKLSDIHDFISQYIKDRGRDEDEYIVTIKKKKKTRTLQENKLIHVLFEMYRIEEGKLGNKYEKDEMKSLIKMALIGVKEVVLGDFVIQYPKKGTSELSIEEACIFIDKMIHGLNKRYGLEIQGKDDQRLLEFYDKYVQ